MEPAPPPAAGRGDGVPTLRERLDESPRRLVVALLVVWAVLTLVYLGYYLYRSRYWFFGWDAFDYLPRYGLSAALEPHQDHITVPASVYVQGARSLVGLDYWPLYPLARILVWPLFCTTALVTFIRRGMPPAAAVLGSGILLWIGTGVWPEESHFGGPLVWTAALIAIHLDEAPHTPWRTAANVVLTGLTLVTASSAALVLLARLGVGALQRRWRVVAITAPLTVGYLAMRQVADVPTGAGFSLGDLGEYLVAAVEVVGRGLEFFVPVTPAAWPVTGSLVLAAVAIAAGWALLRRRYPEAVLFGASLAYLLAVAEVRFVNGFANPSHPRFFHVFLVLVLAGALPPLGRLAGRASPRVAAAAVLAALLLFAYNLDKTFGVLEFTDRKSSNDAAFVAAAVEAIQDGEARHTALGRPLGSRTGGYLSLRRMVAIATTDRLSGTLLESDVYRVAEVLPRHVREVRANLRFAIWPSGRVSGAWGDLGTAPPPGGCLTVEGEAVFAPDAPVTLALTREGASGVDLVWSDEDGEVRRTVAEASWNHPHRTGTVWVSTADPVGPATLRIVVTSGGPIDACL